MVVMLARAPRMHMATAQKLSRAPGEMRPGALSTKESIDANMVVYLMSHLVRTRCLSFPLQLNIFMKGNGDSGDPGSGGAIAV